MYSMVKTIVKQTFQTLVNSRNKELQFLLSEVVCMPNQNKQFEVLEFIGNHPERAVTKKFKEILKVFKNSNKSLKELCEEDNKGCSYKIVLNKREMEATIRASHEERLEPQLLIKRNILNYIENEFHI